MNTDKSALHVQQIAIRALVTLGLQLHEIPAKIIEQACKNNAWFSPFFIQQAAEGISCWFEEEALREFCAVYSEPEHVHDLGIITAGNIPFVGCHDIVIGLLSGCSIFVQASRRDKVLISWFLDQLIEAEPSLSDFVKLVDKLPAKLDRLIATGSDNAAKHFEYSYIETPKVIRKNRTSVAILDDDITDDELKRLAKDIFLYNGLGCRNVTHVCTLKSFEISRLMIWDEYPTTHLSESYLKKFSREKAIKSWLKDDFTSSGKVIITPSDRFSPPPVSVIRHMRFNSLSDVDSWLHEHAEKLQCIVGRNIPFGESQSPKLYDYADGVDTMKFLRERTLS